MKYITEVRELEKHIHLLEGKPTLGADVETTGFDAISDKLRLLQLSTGDETLVIDVFKVGTEATAHYVRPYLEDEKIVKIFHNGKFDLKFIKQQLGIDTERLFDSYLASVLIEAGVKQVKGWHGLGQVLPRYTGIEVSKEEQASDWSENELSDAQLEYAAKDVEVLFPLREKMIETLKALGLIRVAKLEFEAILPIAWLELCGFYLDFDEWMSVARKSLGKANEYAGKLQRQLEPLIDQQSLFDDMAVNLDSQQQIQKYFRQLGVPMPDSTKEYLLTPLAEKYPIVGDLIAYRGYAKDFSSFGEKFKEFINEETGRVHAQFMQIGAETGRLAPNSPNLNQIPAVAERRRCFKAQREDTILISNDYSQEELRILADFSGDKNFKALFLTGEDFHKSTASLVFNIPLDKVTKHDRDIAKRLNFGLTYGVGIAKFALMAGISESEANIVRNNYFDTFKGVNRWIKYQKAKVLNTRYARTASGRMMRYEWPEDDREKMAAAQRNAVNGPIQGTGADVLKKAMRLLYNETRHMQKDVKLVNVVHDQIDMEVREDLADHVHEILTKCMEKAGSEFVKTVEIKVDGKKSKVWIKD